MTMHPSNDNAPLTPEQEFDRANGIEERAHRDWHKLAMDARRRAMMKTGYERKIWMKAAETALNRMREDRALAS
mgnify:CR=1 FL=1